jgi:hypothetical protein
MDEGYRRQSSRRTATSGGAQPTAAAAPNQPNHAVPQVFPLGAAETDYPLGTKSIVKRGANYSPLVRFLPQLRSQCHMFVFLSLM